MDIEAEMLKVLERKRQWDCLSCVIILCLLAVLFVGIMMVIID